MDNDKSTVRIGNDMNSYQLVTADIMDWLNLASRYGYKQNYYHAMLLDPPYHLTSITKRFATGAPAKFGKDGAFRRASAGFMGQMWDGGDLAFNPELWAGLKERLLPGAFCFAFAGSRGWHRMGVAIEDGGFIMHPTIFGWAYGSGFPKATRIDTQIDKAAGAERVPVMVPTKPGNHKGQAGPIALGASGMTDISGPATPEAAQWEGHRYGLQALKPALEPILCFQKPYEGRPLDSITGTGAGALNIDGGRVRVKGESWIKNHDGNQESVYGDGLNHFSSYSHSMGRWPSNFILSHLPDCKRTGDDWQCVDGCPVRRLGEQSGVLKSGKLVGQYKGSNRNTLVYGEYGYADKDFEANSGSASRFFYQAHFAYEIHERLAAADSVRYVAKAGKTERNAGLNKFPIRQAIGYSYSNRPNDPANGMFKDRETVKQNIHPTVKPIALTKYLASLLLPPDAYAPRRILMPFAGSGSEMIGALLAGWDEITGIEKTRKYIPIAKTRLDWWAQWPRWGQDDIDNILSAYAEDSTEDEQLSFLGLL